MIPNVLLIDFDLLFDVHGAFLRYVEKDDMPWPKGESDYKKVTGHSLEEADPEFWLRLVPTGLSLLLIPVMAVHQCVIASTVSTLGEACGKFALVHSIVDFTRAFMPIRGNKYSAFDTHMIMIDGSETEINGWKGPKVLVPCEYNHATGDPVDILSNALEEFDI